MEETHTATSSSAAAVADGASAAATTKTLAGSPSAAKSSSYVKLLIKSSNQQHDDQVIESDMLWTVKRLKSHLALVYPSKPPAAEQKLIYSGQLLSDNLQLKDVIRSYKDVYTQNHIIHLVYTPKNLPPITPAKSVLKTTNPTVPASAMANENPSPEDGLRQRHTAGTSSGQGPLAYPQVSPEQMAYYSQLLPRAMLGNGSESCPITCQSHAAAMGQYNMHAMAMQQAAMYGWMQQVYSQYMEQYLRLSNANPGFGETNVAGVAGTTPPMFPQFPFLAQFPQTVINPAAQSTQASAVALPEQEAPAAQPAEEQAPAPRFPNLVQEEPDNRDWLDNIFSVTRLALFLTILYFNSSPLRCFAVVVIAGIIYLYHIGVIRFRNERNNNNLNRNNNAAQNAAVDQIRQGIDQQRQGGDGQERPAIGENNEQNDIPPPPAAEGNEQPAPLSRRDDATSSDPAASSASESDDRSDSVLATVRTFVVTFFTSLLPETPAV